MHDGVFCRLPSFLCRLLRVWGSSSWVALLLAELEEFAVGDKLFVAAGVEAAFIVSTFSVARHLGHQCAEVLVAVLAEEMSADNKPFDRCATNAKKEGIWYDDSFGSLVSGHFSCCGELL